ncbi:FG-GAP-like repeat-containing protein [Candidatus Eisenbacteria bacterium]|uniref:FG-GAP-like repeat-containing protein n=1 Tax=Eiseniibacteriota bacterium TaxID=2212470 RepID=A0ABV6YJ62_UNCEI
MNIRVESTCSQLGACAICLAAILGLSAILFSGDGHQSQPPGASELPAGANADWWTSVSENLEQAEYHVSENSIGLQAPNRAHNLRTYFLADGIEVVPRDERQTQWHWRWTTRSWGRSNQMHPAKSGEPLHDAARVEFDRGDGLLEWYKNSKSGLEQGFTVDTAPAGSGNICIEGAITGGLSAELDTCKQAIDFFVGDTPVLCYSKLVAIDATGRELPGEMLLADNTILLSIDDRDAVYPILIDPMVRTPEWYLEGEHVGDALGCAVATAGDVNGDGFSDVIVGAYGYDDGENEEGRALLYMGSAAGLETSHSWDNEGGVANVQYGRAVASAGDVNNDGYSDVIVAAPGWDAGGGHYAAGIVFLYLGSASGLEPTDSWSKTGEGEEDKFGGSIANAGDVNGDGYADIIVGAPDWDLEDESIWDCGAAFVYLGTSTGLELSHAWSFVPMATAAYYGCSVSSAGDVNGDGYSDFVVGSSHYTHNQPSEGKVFLYYGSSGTISTTPAWSAEGDQSHAHFGSSVSTAGDVNGDGYSDLIIGAPEYDRDTIENVGKAYVFLGSTWGLDSIPVWTVEGDERWESLGKRVATAGDVNGDGYGDYMITVPHYEDATPGSDQGEVHLYLGYWTGSPTEPNQIYVGDQDHAQYGLSISTAGDVNGDGYSDLIVGSESWDYFGSRGKAYLYTGGSHLTKEVPGWVTEPNHAYARYGSALAGAGDVNCDGFSDVLVGAPGYDYGHVDEGVVFLFLGSHQGLEAYPAWYAEGNQDGAGFGVSVAGAGDVNGDGWVDILIGASAYSGSTGSEGAAFLWFSVYGGGPPGNPSNADWSCLSGQEGSQYGFSVAGAGDVNADGCADIVVGAPYYDQGHTNEGAAFAYYGSETGPSETHDWLRDSDYSSAEYGACVASAGDFNGDGFSDVVIASPKYGHPESTEGLVFVYTGSENGLQTDAPWWFAEGDQAGGRLGISAACAGDVNGDGYSDLIVGAPRYDTPESNAGAAYLFQGAAVAPPTGTPANADWSGEEHQDNAWFGYAVSSAGDVNGDGYSDVLVGSPYEDNAAGSDVGNLYLWLGSSSGLSDGPADWYYEGLNEGMALGYRVDCAGDPNGDGFSDIIAGAKYYDGGHTDEGRAYLFYGNDSRGLSRMPMQWRHDFSSVVAPLGMVDAEDGFVLAGNVRIAGGRGRARLEFEVKPHNIPFDGTGTVVSAYGNTGTPTTSGGSSIFLATYITGLSDGVRYHWRMRTRSKDPLFPTSPWVGLPDNAATEMDLRTSGTALGIAESLPAMCSLRFRGSPNPFNHGTRLAYRLPVNSHVSLKVYNTEGRLVRTLVDERQEAGEKAVAWDGKDHTGCPLSTGVYLGNLQAGERQESRRLLLVR